MEEFRFDGRTAIVTGSGGNPSLGRAHAMLLGARGANVVVNDVGTVPESKGYYKDAASAEAVAEEIRARGGKAVADTHSVATDEGARAIVQTALDSFGSVDILVNNAVVSVLKPFEEMTDRDIHRQIEVGLMGPILMCRAAWPHMRANNYGRIVNITSTAMVGLPFLSIYGIAKAGVLTLARALSSEGGPFNIKANCVNPGAFTRGAMATMNQQHSGYEEMKANMPPELVSPAVAYLAHESCPVSGECIDASAGRVRRIYLGQTAGFRDPALTIEAIAQHWEEVMTTSAETILDHADSNAAERFNRVG